MGGNALKNTYTRVYDRTEYFELANVVYMRLCDADWDVRIIPAYRDKKTFGDMDIVVCVPKCDTRSRVNIIQKLFEPNQIVENGEVISFDFRKLQIDLIFLSEDEFDFGYNYFSYNDLGNFIGRTAYRLGFKFGHDGLWYTFRDPENSAYVFKELLLTQDFYAALTFLGFDAKQYKLGMDSKLDVFEYAASSQYFDPAQFLLHNRGAAARRRDSKRVMYHEMLEYIKERYPELNDESLPTKVDRDGFLKSAMQWFPGFEHRYNVAVSDLTKLKAFKSNFNGELVGEMTGLSGKELGFVMKSMRVYFEKHGLTDYIGTLDQDMFIGWCHMLMNHGYFKNEE